MRRTGTRSRAQRPSAAARPRSFKIAGAVVHRCARHLFLGSASNEGGPMARIIVTTEARERSDARVMLNEQRRSDHLVRRGSWSGSAGPSSTPNPASSAGERGTLGAEGPRCRAPRQAVKLTPRCSDWTAQGRAAIFAARAAEGGPPGIRLPPPGFSSAVAVRDGLTSPSEIACAGPADRRRSWLRQAENGTHLPNPLHTLAFQSAEMLMLPLGFSITTARRGASVCQGSGSDMGYRVPARLGARIPTNRHPLIGTRRHDQPG
jgi:hypothetical protein